jgi:hypothetical protein
MAQSEDIGDGNEDILPFVVQFAIGHDPQGVVVELTYATSVERFENRQLDTATFGFGFELARKLASVLERESRPDRRPPTRRKPH